METLVKMINIFSWIAVIGCPLVVILKIYMQYKYENSLERTLDYMKGFEATYMKGTRTLLIIFFVALVYLIVK